MQMRKMITGLRASSLVVVVAFAVIVIIFIVGTEGPRDDGRWIGLMRFTLHRRRRRRRRWHYNYRSGGDIWRFTRELRRGHRRGLYALRRRWMLPSYWERQRNGKLFYMGLVRRDGTTAESQQIRLGRRWQSNAYMQGRAGRLKWPIKSNGENFPIRGRYLLSLNGYHRSIDSR